MMLDFQVAQHKALVLISLAAAGAGLLNAVVKAGRKTLHMLLPSQKIATSGLLLQKLNCRRDTSKTGPAVHCCLLLNDRWGALDLAVSYKVH